MKKTTKLFFNKRSQFSIRKLTIGVVSLAISSTFILANTSAVDAGVNVFNRQGDPILANDGSLTQTNVGIIQYARGDRPNRYANFDTFNILYDIEEVSKTEHYVNVTMTFNERHDRFDRHYVLFNIPNSLYEPEFITRDEYEPWDTNTPSVTRKYTTWTAQPTEPNTEPWVAYKKYVRPNPDGVGSVLTDNGAVGNKVTGPNSGIVDRVGMEHDRWVHDWSRIDWRYQTNTTPDTSNIYEEQIKKLSRSIYIDDRGGSKKTAVYKFRARVKDYNAPMNFILGYNQPAGGWNNYEAVFGETPDNRDYNLRFPLTLPEKTIVDDLAVINDTAKQSIKDKIVAANQDLFNENNVTKKAVTAIEKITVPSSATSGEKVIVEYTDGSRNELEMSDVVVKKVVATPPTTTTAPVQGNTTLEYTTNRGDGNQNLDTLKHMAISPQAKKWEITKEYSPLTGMPSGDDKSKMTRIQLREKKEVDMATINELSSLSLWQNKLNEIKRDNNIGNITGAGGYPEGTIINGYGTHREYNVGIIYEMNNANTSSAEIKYTTDGKIEGILIKGPRYDDTGDNNTSAGLITADMIFKAGSTDPLPPLKEEAKQTIENLPLSQSDKDSYKNQITGANDQETIERIVGEAKKKASDTQKAKDEAKAQIDKLKYLTPGERENAKQQIDSKFTKEEVKNIVDNATATNLGKAKEKGIADITPLNKLTEAERQDFTNKINGATTPAQVEQFVKDAIAANEKNQAAEEANAEKEEAKKVIDAISGLDSTKRQEFKDQINNATSPKEIDLIIELAKGAAKINEAKAKIDALENLNNAQKQAIKDSIDENTTETNLNLIISEAQELDDSMKYLKDLVEFAKNTKDGADFNGKTEESKNALITALTNAERVTPKESGENAEKPKVDNLIDELLKAIDGLKDPNVVAPTPTVNKQYLQAEYDLVDGVKQGTKYTGAEQDRKNLYDDAANKARDILAKNDATQDEVNKALNDLILAKSALNGQDPTNEAPTFTAPKDLVLFKGVEIPSAITSSVVTDTNGVDTIKIVNESGTDSNLGLALNPKFTDPTNKTLEITGSVADNVAVGNYISKFKATDTLSAESLSNAFNVSVVDVTVNDENTPIVKGYNEPLTAADVKAKLNFAKGDIGDDVVDYDVIIPDTAATSGKDQIVAVTVRTKAPDTASQDVKDAFIPHEKQVSVKVSFNTLADETVVTAPNRVLIDGETPTTQEDKNLIINALKEANKNNDNTSKFPADTQFTVADNGEVTITYPDSSSETVPVTFKQKDSVKYNPTATVVLIDSNDTVGGNLTNEEKEAIKNAVTIPGNPTVTKEIEADKVIEQRDNGPVLVVKVTYDDGTFDEVDVPVKQKDELKYQPLIEQGEAPISVETNVDSEVPEADKTKITDKVNVSDFADKVKSKEVTSNIKEGPNGTKVVDVTVNYNDGTSDVVEVPVRYADSEKYTPTLVSSNPVITSKDQAGETLTDNDLEKVINNVFVPGINGNEAPNYELEISDPTVVTNDQGESGINVTVIYEDGSQEDIFVPISKDTDKDGFSDKEETTAGSEVNDPSSTPDGKTTAGVISLEVPLTEVNDVNNLTDEEKQKVEDNIRRNVDLPDGTNIHVADNGRVLFEFPDNSTTFLSPSETVIAKDTDKDGFSDKEEIEAGTDVNDPSKTPQGSSSAERIAIAYNPVGVYDINNLTDEEIEAVRKSITENNDLPVGTVIDVARDGGVTITYPDGSESVIEPGVLVFLKDTDSDGFSDKEETEKNSNPNDPTSIPNGEKITDKINPVINPKVAVSDTESLTSDEKKEIEDNIRRNNPLPSGTNIQVDEKGKVTITYPDGSNDVIEAADTVELKDTDGDGFNDKEEIAANSNPNDPTSVPNGEKTADKFTPKIDPVEVKDTAKLTDLEKQEVMDRIMGQTDVADAVKDIVVEDNGKTTITYKDDSIDTMEPEETTRKIVVAAPGYSDVSINDNGDVVIVPPGINVTELAITYTPTGSDNPITVTATKENGTWSVPNDSNIKVVDGNIVIPESEVKDGTVVTVVAKNGDVVSSDVGSVVVPNKDNTNPNAPQDPTVTIEDNGNILVSIPSDATSVEITYTPEGSNTPTKVIVEKQPDGTWKAPDGSNIEVVDGNIVIPENIVEDGTSVSAIAKNGDIASNGGGSVIDPIKPTEKTAPEKPGVDVVNGTVTITPPSDNATSIEITYTKTGEENPTKVTVEKQPDGTWKAPDGSGVQVVDGNIVIPESEIKDGTSVTVVAKNGDTLTSDPNSKVVPTQDTTSTVPTAPTIEINEGKDVVITPPSDNATSIEITYTKTGEENPTKVTVEKQPDGTWKAPDGSGVQVVDGKIVIPESEVKDNTTVTAISKNNDATSSDAATINTPQTPAPTAPENPDVTTNDNRDIIITPKGDNVTSLEITYVPEGTQDPVVVIINKLPDGSYDIPSDFRMDGNNIVIPENLVEDGTAVTVVAKNGDVASTTPVTVVAPSEVLTPDTPKIEEDGNNNVIITPNKDNTTSVVITFTPKGQTNPVSVEITKDEQGKWIVPDNSIPVAHPDGDKIIISRAEIENDTAISVIAKNGNKTSDSAEVILVPSKTDAERYDATISGPITVKDNNNLTLDEKQEIEDKIRKENVLPDRTVIVVENDGTVTITYPDKTTDTILPTKTVMETKKGDSTTSIINPFDLLADDDKDGFTNLEELTAGSKHDDPASVPANQKSSDRINIKTNVTTVNNVNALTDSDKKAVKDAIIKNNNLPTGTNITVDNNGNVTITYPDGSVDTLKANATVTPHIPASTTKELPKTGNNNLLVQALGSIALAISGLFVVKSRKKDEE